MRRRATRFPAKSWNVMGLSGLLVGLILSSCAAAPFLIPSILEFGRNLLITSNSNYGNKYREDMNQLLMSVSRSWVNTPYPPRMTQAGFPGQPGMPGQPGFPGGMDPNNPFGQPAQPGMPGQFPPGQPMPGQPGMPFPGNPGQPMPGQPMPGQPFPGMPGQPMPSMMPPPSSPIPPYPGGTLPPPGYPNTPAYPGGVASGFPGPPPQGYPGQPVQPSGYPQGGGGFPPAPPAGFPPTPGYPDPNNPYGQIQGGVPPAQQGFQGYPSSGPSSNPYQGGPNPYPQAGAGQAYPGGMPPGGAYPSPSPAPYPDPNNPYGQPLGSMQPGMQGYPQAGQPNSGFPNSSMAGSQYPNAGMQQYPSGMQGQAPYGGPQPNQMGGMPPTGYPGAMPGIPQPGYPSMPQQGTPSYGGAPQPGYPQNQPGYPGGAPGYGGSPQGYPSQGGYPMTAYQEGMPMSRGIGPIVGPMEVDVALLRQVTTASGKHVALMQDGETLKDGRGNPQLGDKFKIVFRTNADCFMYVIAIDGSGWAQTLWPSDGNSMGNPIAKDKEYTFPDGNQWFSLDQVRGIETIYLIASPGQRPDIEESLKKIAGAERPAINPIAQVQEAPILPAGFGSTAAGQPTTVKLETGQQTEVTPTTYRSAQPGDDVRITRWFKHE